MSRHWSTHEYISSSMLWEFIDNEMRKLDIIQQYDGVESSELCKLLLLGKREMIDAFSSYLHENESTLRDILVNGLIMTAEEIDKDI
jgi:hypothetical protein